MAEQTRESFVEGIEVREGQDGQPPRLGGYAAVFNQETIIEGRDGVRWREKIAPSAFTDAIGRDDVIAAVNHDSKMVLGRSRKGTLTLTSDAHGLRYDVTLPNTTLAKDTVENVRNGNLSGSSFRFTTGKGDIRVVKESGRSADDLPLIVVERVKLIDVGPVTFPAYEGTTVSMRSSDVVPDVVAEFYREQGETDKRSQIEAAAREAAKTPSVKEREAARAQLTEAKAWQG